MSKGLRVRASCHLGLGVAFAETLYAEYVQRYATKEAANKTSGDEEEEADEDMSEIGSISE